MQSRNFLNRFPSKSYLRSRGLLRTSCSALSTLVVLAAASPAFAQSADGSATSSERSTNDDGLPEIVVTAQRRNESAQSVPISIAALASDSLKARGVNNIIDLSGKVPSLTITQTSTNTYFLRGIGSEAANINNEPSVTTYLDGVYLFNTYANNLPLNAVDRVEVLKGPQGTLFGRNTTGGVIQMVTRDPMNQAAEANVGYSSYETVNADAYVSTRIGETAGLSAAIDYRHQNEGWGRNATINEETFFLNHSAAQLKGAIEVTPSTKLAALYLHNEADGDNFDPAVVPGLIRVDGVTSNPRRYETAGNSPSNFRVKSDLGYFKLEQDLGFANLVGLSAYRSTKNSFRFDYDMTPINIVDADLRGGTKNFSQEIQILSPSTSKIKWLMGLYYFRATARYDHFNLTGLALAPNGLESYDVSDAQRTVSKAVFGQVTVPLTAATNLTVGARYTSEQVSQLAGIANLYTLGGTTLVLPKSAQNFTSKKPTWRIALDHHIGANAMVYASYSRGVKTGGYVMGNPTSSPNYLPEELDAFEVGIKSQLFQNHLQVNGAAFLYKFNNIQVQQENAQGTILTNAAEATIKGIEGDVTWRPSAHVSVYGSASYLLSRYDKYPDAIGYMPSGSTFVLDAAGKRGPFAPRFSGAAGLSLSLPMEIGSFVLDGAVQRVSKQYVGPANLVNVPAYSTVNASLSWTDNSEHLSVSLWAKNLLDRDYYATVLEFPFGAAYNPAPPRTIGVKLGFKY